MQNIHSITKLDNQNNHTNNGELTNYARFQLMKCLKVFKLEFSLVFAEYSPNNTSIIEIWPN